MRQIWTLLLVFAMGFLSACSTNPATGEQQFTALMPASQEASVGASEHKKIEAQLGPFMTGPVANYVQRIGQKITPHTERKDVQYKFYVLDSPIVNAFAVPGGYVYISRGLLALANSEAEVASVVGHEMAHITARHSAERVSQGAVVGIGAAILSAVVGDPGVSRAAGLGSELYIKSYSRGQENQADELGLRYMSRAGYNPAAVAAFLHSLDRQTKLDAKMAGRNSSDGPNYFSTHPVTADRVSQTSGKAGQYPQQGITGKEAHLKIIDGMIYGDNPKEGFVKNGWFYHPDLGFKFKVPTGFRVTNTPSRVVSSDSRSGSILLFDAAGDKAGRDPATYMIKGWLADKPLKNVENITINGMRAATAAYGGKVQGRNVTIRVVAVEWKKGQFFRFQIAIPTNTLASIVEDLKKTTYSFARLNAAEKKITPPRIDVVTARAGDTLQSFARRMAAGPYREERFLVLNGLRSAADIKAGQRYKIIVE